MRKSTIIENESKISKRTVTSLSDEELNCVSGGMLLKYVRWVCLDCGSNGEWMNGCIDECDKMAHQSITGHSNFITETVNAANYET